MTPALWAVISFSIFIASMMQMSWPSSTVCALLDEDLPHVALQRRVERVRRRRRAAALALAAARACGAAGRGAVDAGRRHGPATGGGPMTLTSKRRPETSTV